jgi:hypothetical protein
MRSLFGVVKPNQAATIGADVRLPDVIAEDDEVVRLLARGLRGHRCGRHHEGEGRELRRAAFGEARATEQGPAASAVVLFAS